MWAEASRKLAVGKAIIGDSGALKYDWEWSACGGHPRGRNFTGSDSAFVSLK